MCTREQHKVRCVQWPARRAFSLLGGRCWVQMNNSTLEAKLVEREREVEQLKFLVDRKMQSGGGGKASQQAAGDPSNDLAQAVATPGSVAPAVAAPFAPAPSSCSSGSCAAPTAAGVASCQAATATGGGCGGDCLVCCSPLLKDVADIDFDAEFEERVGALARLVDDHGLRETDPSGELSSHAPWLTVTSCTQPRHGRAQHSMQQSRQVLGRGEGRAAHATTLCRLGAGCTKELLRAGPRYTQHACHVLYSARRKLGLYRGAPPSPRL